MRFDAKTSALVLLCSLPSFWNFEAKAQVRAGELLDRSRRANRLVVRLRSLFNLSSDLSRDGYAVSPASSCKRESGEGKSVESCLPELRFGKVVHWDLWRVGGYHIVDARGEELEASIVAMEVAIATGEIARWGDARFRLFGLARVDYLDDPSVENQEDGPFFEGLASDLFADLVLGVEMSDLRTYSLRVGGYGSFLYSPNSAGEVWISKDLPRSFEAGLYLSGRLEPLYLSADIAVPVVSSGPDLGRVGISGLDLSFAPAKLMAYATYRVMEEYPGLMLGLERIFDLVSVVTEAVPIDPFLREGYLETARFPFNYGSIRMHVQLRGSVYIDRRLEPLGAKSGVAWGGTATFYLGRMLRVGWVGAMLQWSYNDSRTLRRLKEAYGHHEIMLRFAVEAY